MHTRLRRRRCQSRQACLLAKHRARLGLRSPEKVKLRMLLALKQPGVAFPQRVVWISLAKREQTVCSRRQPLTGAIDTRQCQRARAGAAFTYAQYAVAPDMPRAGVTKSDSNANVSRWSASAWQHEAQYSGIKYQQWEVSCQRSRA